MRRFIVAEAAAAAAAAAAAGSDDQDDDLPDFLLPDSNSSRARKLPDFRTGAAPKIIKASLKDYHGLEGVSHHPTYTSPPPLIIPSIKFVKFY